MYIRHISACRVYNNYYFICRYTLLNYNNVRVYMHNAHVDVKMHNISKDRHGSELDYIW